MEVDLEDDLPNSVKIETFLGTFEQEVIYENLPPQSSHCQKIGHLSSECKLLSKKDGKNDSNQENLSSDGTRELPCRVPIKKNSQVNPNNTRYEESSIFGW